MSTTAQAVLDQARIRHPSFAEAEMPEGALLLFLNQRQRSLLVQAGDHLGPLVTTTAAIATTIRGTLVGSSGGVPVYLTTYEDGWPVFLGGTGVPYFDFTGPKIAGDPFGENGGTPGFPLPDNFVSLQAITVTYSSGLIGPVDVIPERARHEHAQGRNPAVFISGNRLVPVLPTSASVSRGEWIDVVSLSLTYIALPALTSLTDLLLVPDAVVEVLIADVAALLAMRAKGLSKGERDMYREDAQVSAAKLAEGRDLVGDVSTSTVQYSGPG